MLKSTSLDEASSAQTEHHAGAVDVAEGTESQDLSAGEALGISESGGGIGARHVGCGQKYAS